MQPQQIRFSAHPGTFQVRTLRCNHLECPCTNVSFALIELPDGNRHFKPPARINIRVDVPTWQEVDPPDRSAQEAAVVAEFLRDYPPAERQELQAYFDDRRTINRRLKEGRISRGKIEDQELIERQEVQEVLRTGRQARRLVRIAVERHPASAGSSSSSGPGMWKDGQPSVRGQRSCAVPRRVGLSETDGRSSTPKAFHTVAQGRGTSAHRGWPFPHQSPTLKGLHKVWQKHGWQEHVIPAPADCPIFLP